MSFSKTDPATNVQRCRSDRSGGVFEDAEQLWFNHARYDGFGNLTAKVLNGSTTPIAVTASTNRLTYSSYDANGNMLTGVGATFTYL